MADRAAHRVRSWGLWALPAPAMVFLLLVELTALVCAAGLLSDRAAFGGTMTAVILGACGVVSVEGARRVERRRRRGGALHKDLQPVWMIAAAIALPAATALVCVVALRLWWRVRASRCIPHRWVFSTAVAMLAAAFAHSTYVTVDGALTNGDWSPRQVPILAMVAAAVVFIAVDAVLCAVVIRLLDPASTPSEMFGDRAGFTVDAVAAGLGCLVAAASMVTPWAGILGVSITLAGQRALLLGQLESEASTDGKTELTNFPRWRQEVEELLDRARRRDGRFAILLADIDHFKLINDHHGHLAGDHVLRQVADRIRSVIRSADVAGRFGGEEFVIGMPDVDVRHAVGAAHRLRSAISDARLPLRTRDSGDSDSSGDSDDSGDLREAALPAGADWVRLTVSVGVAVYPVDGTTLDQLLEFADRGLYAAKTAGRDRVSRGLPPAGEVLPATGSLDDSADGSGADPLPGPVAGPVAGSTVGSVVSQGESVLPRTGAALPHPGSAPASADDLVRADAGFPAGAGVPRERVSGTNSRPPGRHARPGRHALPGLPPEQPTDPGHLTASSS
ncbi:diguanylate cyclase [Actinopolymorpha sp. NPDC004070]|uniref:sensor domain-containing diguanylate cyclase n=1 Tax=Actinopolymorpha sp. NPDC004070 TaxID=3154548 RepID=UPI0033AAF234